MNPMYAGRRRTRPSPAGHPAPGSRIRLVIVVDTNVVSELMRPSPSPRVRDWVNAQAPGELCTTAVTVAEIRYGLERLPDGFDAQIAAICRTHGAALATRNTKDFRETGIDLIDPWQEG